MSEREPSQDDAVWQDLVARLESTESAPDPQGHQAQDSGTGAAAPGGPRDYLEAEDDDAGYVPPEPAPLGTGDPLVVLAWCGAAGAPLALLLMAIFWRSAPFAVIIGMVVLFVAGAAYLVSRLPGERDHGDDGAQV
ncbi:hypothetical protein D477_006626 [Arthrobacter crystallopoietes BAB-32]|uniref:Uncharacterized protein n=1 Tax=Arthrobacter crystallopoietes BAB-32 TaxID=1246476 RepID=N1V4S2_9MICC|nr:hypothetical protein [Arthrobacter crystallopoietes]EMY35019.1 hypothetical protein D477_006626 [Arthrobacter crystallopoietes BAB-32]